MKARRLSAGSDAECRCGADRQPQSQVVQTMGGTDRRPPARGPDSGHYEVASDAGGRRAAAIYSLIDSAKLNGLNPQHYLADVLARIAGHPPRRIAELFPSSWQPRDATRASAYAGPHIERYPSSGVS